MYQDQMKMKKPEAEKCEKLLKNVDSASRKEIVSAANNGYLKAGNVDI